MSTACDRGYDATHSNLSPPQPCLRRAPHGWCGPAWEQVCEGRQWRSHEARLRHPPGSACGVEPVRMPHVRTGVDVGLMAQPERIP